MKKIVLRFCCLVFVLCISRVSFAFAKSDETKLVLTSDVDRPNIPTTDTLTVISSRLPGFKSRLTDLPANVSFIPANVSYKAEEELDWSQPRQFQDAVQDLEGALFYDQVGNGVDTTFSLRGFSEGSNVIVLVDGVRVNELDGDSVNYPLVPVHDIEFIQIERGSASPIYGSGAFAGVVNIVTRKPSQKLVHLFGGTELSSFKGIRFHQGASGTIQDTWTPVEGKVTYYFNMGRDQSEGFRDNGEWRITDLDAKLGYELADGTGDIHAGIKHINDAVSNPGALTVPEFHEDPEQTKNPLAGRDFRNTIIQMGADKKFWDERITSSILASWRVNLIHFFTTSRTFPDGAFNPDTDLVTTKSRATDLIWQAAYDDRWAWFGNQALTGFELRDASGSDVEQDAFTGNVNETSPRETERGYRPENFAFFWRDTVNFFDLVFAHLGMRHDFHKLKTRDHLTPANDLSRRWRDSSVSTGITVKPVEFADLYGNYSQGFRVPTISEIAPFSSGISTELVPEETDSYEIGSRLRYKKLAQAKISLFLIDLKNEIAFDSTSITQATPFGQNVNIGKSRREGVETRFDLIPVPELDAYGSYTWMKAYVRETTGDGVPFDGRDLGLVPRHRFTLGTALRPFYRFGKIFEGLRISMDGVYTGKQFVQSHESESQALIDAAGETINAYTVWNGTVTFEWHGYQIYFKINNIFDRHYYSRAVAATNFGSNITPAGTHLFVNPGAPREYVMGMTWEFGK